MKRNVTQCAIVAVDLFLLIASNESKTLAKMNMIYVDVVRTGQVKDATTMSVLVHVFVIAVEVLQVQTVDFV